MAPISLVANLEVWFHACCVKAVLNVAHLHECTTVIVVVDAPTEHECEWSVSFSVDTNSFAAGHLFVPSFIKLRSDSDELRCRQLVVCIDASRVSERVACAHEPIVVVAMHPAKAKFCVARTWEDKRTYVVLLRILCYLLLVCNLAAVINGVFPNFIYFLSCSLALSRYGEVDVVDVCVVNSHTTAVAVFCI